jgi:hypothetical protein
MRKGKQMPASEHTAKELPTTVSREPWAAENVLKANFPEIVRDASLMTCVGPVYHDSFIKELRVGGSYLA